MLSLLEIITNNYYIIYDNNGQWFDSPIRLLFVTYCVAKLLNYRDITTYSTTYCKIFIDFNK